jgi:outer membrane protein assembly factor BamB
MSAAEPSKPSLGWRGDGSGRFAEAQPPIEWDGESGKNIVWKTKVGVSKFSSPVFVQGKLFIVSEPAQLVCLDAETGTMVWERTNGWADLPSPPTPKQPRGDQGNTTPTPVSDGRFVYAAFGSGIVACYDLDGVRKWIRYVDAPPGLDFGRSASPALLGGRLLVSMHHLFALESETGKVAWQNESATERYGTPVAARIGGVDIVATPSGHIARLSDGSLLFAAAELTYASPIMSDGVAYYIGTAASAVSFSRAGESLVAKSVWKAELDGSYFASPVCDRGLIYTVSNEGVFLILKAADGKTVATRELDIGSASGRPGLPNANLYPSLALAGNYVFLSNDIGDTLVLEPGAGYKEIKRNNLGEGFSGAPVFAGKRMYVRAKERVYCIGTK